MGAKALLVLPLLAGLLLAPLAEAPPSLGSPCGRAPADDFSVAQKASRALRASCTSSWQDATVEWRLDGVVLAQRMLSGSPPANEVTLIFEKAGTRQVTAALRSPAGATATVDWTVEVVPPKVLFPLSYCSASGATSQSAAPGATLRLAARCTAPSSSDREFRTVEWFVDNLRVRNDPRTGAALDAFHDVAFQTSGAHRVHLVANDTEGFRSIVTWTIQVAAPPPTAPSSTPPPTPGTTPTPTTSPTPVVSPTPAPPPSPGGQGATDAGHAWTTVFATIAGGITLIGGAIVGVLKLWRRGGDDKAPAPGQGPPPAPPAPAPDAEGVPVEAASVVQRVGANSGTVIGSAGTVVLGGGAPAPEGRAGVLPRLAPLYAGLEEAHDHLDDPGAGREALHARELVRQVMAELERGERPRAELRSVTARAIEEALETGAERVRRGEPALRRVVEHLRR